MYIFYLFINIIMKKIIMLLGMLVFGSFIAMMAGCSNDNTVLYNEAENKQQTDTITTMQKMFADKKAQTCYFTMSKEDGNVYDGKLYVEWKKMYYSMNTYIDGQEVVNNIIIKDGYTYGRSTQIPESGYKTKETPDDVNGDTVVGEEERTKENTYTCYEGVEQSYFELPQDVVFVELQM